MLYLNCLRPRKRINLNPKRYQKICPKVLSRITLLVIAPHFFDEYVYTDYLRALPVSCRQFRAGCGE